MKTTRSSSVFKTWFENGRLKPTGRANRSSFLSVSSVSETNCHEVPDYNGLPCIVPFLLRNIWTSTLLLFAFLMFTTFFINKVWQVSRLVELGD